VQNVSASLEPQAASDPSCAYCAAALTSHMRRTATQAGRIAPIQSAEPIAGPRKPGRALLARPMQRVVKMIRSRRHFTSTDIEWITVSGRRPCPVCGGSLQCQVQAEGAFAACNIRPSDWPMTSGAWLHRIELPAPSLLEWELPERESGVNEVGARSAAVHGSPTLEAVRSDVGPAALRSVGIAS
jgi:hypothetical protein